ncbi:MAG: STAS/SEC14 domain-containing protein [Verrucomicrobiota bacterium JB025]|nr:STAS/SEC14 domain-containing protein [Verrucomicrobiota bacterium JB025]
MPETLKVNNELGIIELRAFGVLKKEEMLQTLEELKRLSAEHGILRLLADVSAVEHGPSVDETFEIFSSYPEGMKHAIVSEVPLPPKVVRDVRFIENLSIRRKRAIGVFDSREDAVRWLVRK